MAVSNVLQFIIPGSEREKLTLEYCLDHNLVFGLTDYLKPDKKELLKKVKSFVSDPDGAEMVKNLKEKLDVNGTKKVVETIDKVITKDRRED